VCSQAQLYKFAYFKGYIPSHAWADLADLWKNQGFLDISDKKWMLYWVHKLNYWNFVLDFVFDDI